MQRVPFLSLPIRRSFYHSSCRSLESSLCLGFRQSLLWLLERKKTDRGIAIAMERIKRPYVTITLTRSSKLDKATVKRFSLIQIYWPIREDLESSETKRAVLRVSVLFYVWLENYSHNISRFFLTFHTESIAREIHSSLVQFYERLYKMKTKLSVKLDYVSSLF